MVGTNYTKTLKMNVCSTTNKGLKMKDNDGKFLSCA